MNYSLVIAGLATPVFDRLRKESDKRIAPGGKLFVRPNIGFNCYSKQHSCDLIRSLYEHVAALNEDEHTRTLLLYVDFEDTTTALLLEEFFPFSIPMPLSRFVVEDGLSRRVVNERLNIAVDEILTASIRVRELSRIVSGFTNVTNLNPLLLPCRNFRSSSLETLLRSLYLQLANAADPKTMVEGAINKFLSKTSRVQAPGDTRHCFSDGQLYFRSPGKNRHGFLRKNSYEAHKPSCLLNARSRIGGAYSFTLHYDCIPVRGGLKSEYENCHGCPSPPKEKHVNIAPNDFII